MQSVNKLAAAERQLKVAVRLFFEQRDILAVLTLTGAAGQILRDIARARGLKSFFYDNPLVREEMRQEWVGFLNGTRNFVKHADKDPEDVHEFNPELVRFLLFDACLLHRELTKPGQDEMNFYLMWFQMMYPDMVKPGAMKSIMNDALRRGVDPTDFEVLRMALDRLISR